MSDIKISCEDCMDLMSRYPDKYFDIAIVDPPYGQIDHSCKSGALYNKSKHSYADHRSKTNGSHKVYNYALHKTSGWDVAPPPEYFSELFRVSKEQIIWGGNYFALPPSRNFIVWRKTRISETFTMAMAEYAWTSIQGNAKVIECAPQDKNRFHPTQKPVLLYKKLLQWYSKAGDKILDTHLGSGSSAIACIDFGLDLTACELDKDYYDQAMTRIKEHQSQKELFAANAFSPSSRVQEDYTGELV